MNGKTIGTSAGIIGGILSAVLIAEGVYSYDPYDHGGETKYGITEKVAKDYGYSGEMKDLTQGEALEIYEELYVLEPHFDEMVKINPAVAHKLIDAGVNVGTSRVSIWFQKSLNNLSRNGEDYPLIDADGIIGPKTLSSYLALEKLRGKEKACSLILKSLDGYQTYYYSSLTQHRRYLAGWLDKRIGNVSFDQCSNYNLHIPLIKLKNEDQ